MSKLYIGKRTPNGFEVSVIIDEDTRRVRKRPLRHIPFHSPSGFEWGHQGSGPADLALAILIDYLREHPPRKGWLAGEKFARWSADSQAFKHHQYFKRAFIATFGDEWKLSGMQIDAWLNDRKENKDGKRDEGNVNYSPRGSTD